MGRKGSGKTWRAWRRFKASKNALVFNVAFDQTYLIGATHHVTDDLVTVGTILRREPEFRIVFESEFLVPHGQSVRYPKLDPVLQECFERGNMTVFLDEAHQLCNPWSATFGLLKTVRIGRHRDLNIEYITQRFAMVHRELTAASDELHFFRCTEPRDLEEIERRCGPTIADRVANLDPFHKEQSSIVPGEVLVWTVEGKHYVEQGEKRTAIS